VIALNAIGGIVRRDLRRAARQPSRLIGGLARPFVWLLLVASGYNAIASPGSGATYREFVFPGVIVMACLFGAALTAVSTVYDREFGMLRLMLASPAGPAVVLAGRAVSATAVGLLQGLVVLAAAPLVTHITWRQAAAAAAAIVIASMVSALLGLLVAVRLRSVENFAGIVNVLLFPMLFISGALYPAAGLPPVLREIARVNPVTHMVELVRAALGQPTELSAAANLLALAAFSLVAFVLASLLFDPEQRFVGRPARTRAWR
jgi:ABC-2 type transport system permease protein